MTVELHLGDCLEQSPWYNGGMPKGVPLNREAANAKRSASLRRGSEFSCVVCSTKFWRKPYDIARGDCKFCSKACYFEWQVGKPKTVAHPRPQDGKNNPNWRGGITPEHTRLRNSGLARVWRNKVLDRDKRTCQSCGSKQRLHVHHIKPFATYPELRFDTSNGIVLCHSCHHKEPKGMAVYGV